MSVKVGIIGAGEVGQNIADRLEYRGDAVRLVEQDKKRVEVLEAAGYHVYHGDGTDLDVLRDAGFERADLVVVATGRDDSNLLAAQLVRNTFNPEFVVARVNRPENEGPFEDLGIRTISRSDATARIMDLYIESPSFTQWMESVGHRGDVQEVSVRNPDFTGLTIRQIDAMLPDQVLMTMVGDETDAHLPDPDEIISWDDHVTVLGERTAVYEAMQDLSGDGIAGEQAVGEQSRRQ